MRTGRALLGLVIILVLPLAVMGHAWPNNQGSSSNNGTNGNNGNKKDHQQGVKNHPGTINLKGKLTNANNDPISNAVVSVALWNTIPQVKTDAQGHFILDELYAKLTDKKGELIAGAQVALPAAEARNRETNPQGIFKINSISGTVRQPDGEAIADAAVTVVPPVIRTGNTDKDGKFTIAAVTPGPANITYSASGYDSLIEKGIPLVKGMILNRTLREKSTGWWLMLLFVPAVLGMCLSGIRNFLEVKKGWKINRFIMAGLYGSIWFVVLYYPLATEGISKYEFLYPSLTFEFYVPLLGFLGAMLYVLDLSRKGQEEINKEAEFQQRIILGPYVAIVMVVLFGKNLGIVDITSPIGRATIAFVSGFLVVAFLQRIVEKGQEILGEWRDKSSSYYAQSEIAANFNLSKEDDLKLRKAGIRYLSQLDEYQENKLVDKVKEVGFDATLAVALKKELPKQRLHQEIARDYHISAKDLDKLQMAGIYHLGQLQDMADDKLKEIAQKFKFDENLIMTLKQTFEKRLKRYEQAREEDKSRLLAAIGDMAWARLATLNVKTIEDFSHLSDKALEEIGEDQPEIDKEDLKKLRDKAKKFGLMQY